MIFDRPTKTFVKYHEGRMFDVEYDIDYFYRIEEYRSCVIEFNNRARTKVLFTKNENDQIVIIPELANFITNCERRTDIELTEAEEPDKDPLYRSAVLSFSRRKDAREFLEIVYAILAKENVEMVSKQTSPTG